MLVRDRSKTSFIVLSGMVSSTSVDWYELKINPFKNWQEFHITIPPTSHKFEISTPHFAMASQDPSAKDAAAKARIMNHMNSDHQDSLIRYLQHYAHLSSFSARNAHLSDITFSSLTILSSNKIPHTISIKPPMTAWSEARPRVVAMDAEATAALQKSSITVKRYKEPRGWMMAMMVAVCVTFVVFSRRSNFRPGNILYDTLLGYVPMFAGFCWKIQPVVIFPMVVIHTAEVIYMQTSRLEKHTVKMFSLVWWKWLVSAFAEGFSSFWRFDEVVREEEAKKAAAKH